MKIELEKSFPSDWTELRGALDELAGLAHRVGLPDEDAEAFFIALWEAVANAVKHGNSGRAERKVWLRCGLEPDQLWARVRDEGESFDSSGLAPEPEGPPGLEALPTSGWGILIMRELCDKVEWSRHGTEVRLWKRCSRAKDSSSPAVRKGALRQQLSGEARPPVSASPRRRKMDCSSGS